MTLQALREKLDALGLSIPLSERTEILGTPMIIGQAQLRNRLAIQPMEGCDGTPDGSPGELTVRRYGRFARGGAGLLWFEATAITPGAGPARASSGCTRGTWTTAAVSPR